MNIESKTVEKLIEVLQKNGSDVIQLYTERAITSGALGVVVYVAFSLLVGKLMRELYKRYKSDEYMDKELYWFGMLLASCFVFVTIVLAGLSLISFMHPEAQAIDQLITDVRS